jgi:thiamine biosynthesis protein ThiI
MVIESPRVVICRYGEIFLKGQNRGSFERTLAATIKKRMCDYGVVGKVRLCRNRILIETEYSCDFLQAVFGIISYSLAHAVPFTDDLHLIIAEAKRMLSLRSFDSFKVHAKHLTPLSVTSLHINQQVGAAIVEQFGARVDLEKPSVVLGIEIIDSTAYVYTSTHAGPGGLPVGVSGTVRVLDGPFARLAALLMMKRGCSVLNGDHFIGAFGNLNHSDQEMAVVSGSLDAVPLNIDVSTLYPLAGMTAGEAQEKLSHYETVYRTIQSGKRIEI